MTGGLPEELADLRKPEIALISANRIVMHGIVLRSNGHEGVYGWHAMYESKVDLNIGHIQQLVDAGMKGEIVVVLCGPWTSTAAAMAKKEMTIRPDRVVKAFEW